MNSTALKTRSKRHSRFFLSLIGWWILAGYLYLIIRFIGHPGIASNPLDPRTRVDPVAFFTLGTIGGTIMGILHGLLEKHFDHRRFQSMSYGRLLLTKGLTFFIILSIVFIGITAIDFAMVSEGFDFIRWMKLLFDPRLLIPLLYTSLVAFAISFIRQVSIKFGPGNLRKMLTGAFHHPREEERIFMFMDMKDSTTIAEKLGHIRFSRLIQDCFRDLPIVEQNYAEIYQYVGDEVILSWKVEVGIRNYNCITAYFNYVKRLHEQTEYYMEHYGLVPEFKAGVNLGMVTVAEIGTIKKDIAYHGDTLNTAARIEGMCNTLKAPLLISDVLKARLDANPGYRIESMGSFPLRGKEEQIELFRVRRIETV
jgi:adenylate cyclase